jgi:hypothetical protein
MKFSVKIALRHFNPLVAVINEALSRKGE